MNGWIGVDFDGTLATYESGQWPELGEPVPVMVRRVKTWLADGKEVRIVTARVGYQPDPEDVGIARKKISKWCLEHIGQALPIMACKDRDMIALWDDRAVTVEKNTGRILTLGVKNYV